MRLLRISAAHGMCKKGNARGKRATKPDIKSTGCVFGGPVGNFRSYLLSRCVCVCERTVATEGQTRSRQKGNARRAHTPEIQPENSQWARTGKPPPPPPENTRSYRFRSRIFGSSAYLPGGTAGKSSGAKTPGRSFLSLALSAVLGNGTCRTGAEVSGLYA